jgi:hypothetical protein
MTQSSNNLLFIMSLMNLKGDFRNEKIVTGILNPGTFKSKAPYRSCRLLQILDYTKLRVFLIAVNYLNYGYTSPEGILNDLNHFHIRIFFLQEIRRKKVGSKNSRVWKGRFHFWFGSLFKICNGPGPPRQPSSPSPQYENFIDCFCDKTGFAYA